MNTYISSIPTQPVSPITQRQVVFLGSTGSIGTSALKVVRKHPERFSVLGLAAGNNVSLLVQQALEFRPQVLGVLTPELAQELRTRLPAEYRPHIVTGRSGYEEMARLEEADLVLSAQVGAAGLAPTLAAVQAGKWVALANKESMVLAGSIIREECRKSGAVILPVDSEHNALFQAACGHEFDTIRTLHLTASGGPFRGRDQKFLDRVTPDQALKHPNWDMGAKISIDSATLMNKGLELIEAHHLFGMGMDRMEVVVHPESIIHSLVEYVDGSFLAHMGTPDMQIPIAYCLGFPQRMDLGLAPLDLAGLGTLHFEHPDPACFPCLGLAIQALGAGPSYPVVLNAANEIAVDLFLKGTVSFPDIPTLVGRALQWHQGEAIPDLETVLDLDHRTRAVVHTWATRP
ncbi:MAG: 1-deoxy-D-xylulose-5-phosphate reductoisomerase [Desulfovibrionales bacterium]